MIFFFCWQDNRHKTEFSFKTLAWLLPGKEKQKITQETPHSSALKLLPELLEEGVEEREGEKGVH